MILQRTFSVCPGAWLETMRLLLFDMRSERGTAVGAIRPNLCRTGLCEENVVQHASKSLTVPGNRSRVPFVIVDITRSKNRGLKQVLPRRQSLLSIGRQRLTAIGARVSDGRVAISG